MITKEELRKRLPHGSLADIAQIAGVTKSAVTNYFNDSTKSSRKIETAALQVALEYQKQRETLVSKLKSIAE
jgi:DNA-binding LacI/PurR family transcriptional regulator